MMTRNADAGSVSHVADAARIGVLEGVPVEPMHPCMTVVLPLAGNNYGVAIA
jgi:hypothetical protein